MLGRREMPQAYVAWNERWGAPYGHQGPARLAFARLAPRALRPRVVGPFGFQPNNSIRRFEYPWAYFASDVRPGHRVVDVGGGLAGFQFVLARAGAQVHNVDPGRDDNRGWPAVTEKQLGRLNRAFGCCIELHRATLCDAALPSGQFDRVFSISTLEHLPHAELRSTVADVRRLLVPGGRFVLSVDLFLDLYPFTDATENQFGTNVDIRWLVEESGLELAAGRRAELFGFEEFDPGRILRRLGDYCCGDQYPALCQVLVLAP